jgi:two-component system alkaline phosphatase synthesis response regulator PhoP
MAARSLATRKTGKVLVINADLEIIRILEVNLSHANLETITARSGRDAIEKIQKDSTDIIILDPALPDVDHNEICLKITESSRANQTPIIIIDDGLSPGNRMTPTERISNITKPFAPKEVVAMVQARLQAGNENAKRGGWRQGF